MKITKKTKINDAIRENPESIEFFLDIGVHCFGCPMRSSETIEEGLKAHGFSEKEIDEFVNKLNKKNKK